MFILMVLTWVFPITRTHKHITLKSPVTVYGNRNFLRERSSTWRSGTRSLRRISTWWFAGFSHVLLGAARMLIINALHVRLCLIVLKSVLNKCIRMYLSHIVSRAGCELWEDRSRSRGHDVLTLVSATCSLLCDVSTILQLVTGMKFRYRNT